MADINNKLIGRRQLIASTAAAASLAALAGCGKKSDSAAGGEEGGTLRYGISNPVSIDPYNLQESEGMAVSFQLFDTLTRYDFENKELVPLACTSWDVSDDATEFTFHLVEGATFHDGTPVTAQSFKYGWERICNNETNPETPSQISYLLSMVEGYNDDGNTPELTGMTCPDDLTLVIKLKYPFADFPFVCSYPGFAPIPECAKDDFMSYFVAPVGNGPFMMDGKWEDGQYITLKRYDNYYGKKASIAGINYSIIKDVETAYREFEAGNLDYSDVPVAQISSARENYGEAEDGYHATPGNQVLLGAENSSYYIVLNHNVKPFDDVNVRRAMSLAINREAICETIFQGTRTPADSVVPPQIAGYEAGSWPYCRFDVDEANRILDEAGYPMDENGSRGLEFTLSYNNDGDHAAIMTSVSSDLEKVGIHCIHDTPEWAALLSKYDSMDYEMGRMGWTLDYPIIDNILSPLFTTGAGDNRMEYSNPAVDEAIMAARSTVDDAERLVKWQEVNRMVGEDAPLIPILWHNHCSVTSSNVSKFFLDPTRRSRINEAELA